MHVIFYSLETQITNLMVSQNAIFFSTVYCRVKQPFWSVKPCGSCITCERLFEMCVYMYLPQPGQSQCRLCGRHSQDTPSPTCLYSCHTGRERGGEKDRHISPTPDLPPRQLYVRVSPLLVEIHSVPLVSSHQNTCSIEDSNPIVL